MLCLYPLDLPSGHRVRCRQCMNCRIRHKLSWMGRLVLEARYTSAYTFLTLTYSDDSLPEGGNLNPADLKFFTNKLRKRIGTIRYFAVGEYGDQKGRPHYHLILFGIRYSEAWQKVFDECWTREGELIGWCPGEHPRGNREALAYALGYVTKKMTSPDDERLDGRHPEFMRCSSYPPLGEAGMVALGDMLTTRASAEAIAEHGFPMGFKVDGQWFPFFSRDRERIMERAGYSVGQDEIREDHAAAGQWDIDRLDLYRKAEAFHWSATKLREELLLLTVRQDYEEIERQRVRARLKAEKARRRAAAQKPAARDLQNPPVVH